jgi:hypothetical protein
MNFQSRNRWPKHFHHVIYDDSKLRLMVQMTSRIHMKRKDVDDVLGGEDHWKHADSTAGLSFLLHMSF